ncbi:MAG: aspartate-semialdehyde dehydrogenase [Gammaproteobacteria bacterium]
MERTFNVAVVGATGLVGRTMLEMLAVRNFPVGKIHALASERSEGEWIEFGKRRLKVEVLDAFDFAGTDIVLSSAGAEVSREFAPRAATAGATVIDNTSVFRYESDVPLVVPEVNPEKIADRRHRGIIANPNCSTIQLVVALKPIYDAVGIERINVVTYQSVSGAGKKGVEELAAQSARLLNGQSIDECTVAPRQIAFNVLPYVGEFQDNGYTREEMKLVWETQKILGDESIRVNPTAVRVPVFFGHSEAVHVETARKISAGEARELFAAAPGIVVKDERDPRGYATAVTEAAYHDEVFVSRIREDLSHPRGLDFWVVADNIRKGAALNSVQIAEQLILEIAESR